MKAKLLLTCVFALPVVWAGTAMAQTNAANDTAADDSMTIIVTAQKREQSVQDVPISMNVFEGDKLADNNISSIQNLTSQVPGLVYVESPTIPVLQMRGFSSPANNPSADQTVAVYQDGIFGGRARQFQRPFFDVERLEVLRGSQGALLGKNTAAGALSIISKGATDSFEGGLSATYLFERKGVDANGFLSGPLSEKVSARAAVNYRKTSRGWMNNIATGTGDPREDIFSGRLTMDFHPSDTFESVLRAEFSRVIYHGTAGANFPGTVPLVDSIRFQRNMPGVFGVEDGLNLKSWQVSNTANIGLGDLTLVSVTGAAGFSGTSVGGGGANNPEVFGTTLIERFEQYSQEFRLMSPTDRKLEWIVGVYADTAKYHSENIPRYNLLGGAVNGQGHTYFDESGQTLSGYLTATYHATDALQLIGGARVTYLQKHGTFLVQQDFGPAFGYVPGLFRDQTISDTFFDPSVTLQYDISPDVMVYASWQRGSKGGNFQSTNRTVSTALFALQPERSESFEAGFKASVDRWLTLNVSAFQLTFTNLQSSQFIGTPPTLTVVNVGRARSRELEYTLALRPLPGLTISASGAYIDAKFLDYAGAPCTFSQLAAGCINGTINAAGRPLAVPKFSGTVSIDYRTALSGSIDGFFSATMAHQTRSNVDANVQNPFFGYKPANQVVDGRIGFGANDKRWELALVASNLFNVKTWNSAIAWGPPFVSTQTVNARINPGRSIGLQVKLKM